MHIIKTARRLIVTMLVLAVNLAMSACSGLTSPIDQAYYSGGDVFAIPGGYNRTIFSTTNF